MRRVTRSSALLGESRRFRAAGDRIGFVPTMGYLHEGHLSLVRRAREENERVFVSLFVNPLQFAPGEDFRTYPRDLVRDRGLLRDEGVDVLFEPPVDGLYPDGFATRVHVDRLGDRLCGAFRPGHFDGVTTVVAKLLGAADPDRLYLGQKDYQQAMLLSRMIRDLDRAVRVVVCPTVREQDGLAMSSRNAYLTRPQRDFAPELYASLRSVADRIESGEIRTASGARGAVRKRLEGGPGRLEYVEILSAEDLEEVRRLRGRMVLALAYHLGRARLIDNVLIRLSPRERRRAPAASRRAGGRGVRAGGRSLRRGGRV